MSVPLTGLRVADFTKFLPGPYCTWMLADLGAEVIRIEHPRELAKQAKVFGWDRLSPEDRAAFREREVFSRNKRSISLDPGDATAREAIFAILKASDVLVEDYRPGVMAAMGLDYETVRSVNPALVYCSITLCGQTGPAARKPGHDPIALAISGVLSRTGESPDAPGFPGVPVADLLSGSNAVIGILAALTARATDGLGQHVDIAMSDSAMPLIGTLLSRNADPARLPPRGRQRIDCGIWETGDGQFLVTTDMETAYWQRFCEAIGRPDCIPLQLSASERPRLQEEFAALFRTRTLAEWTALLEAAQTQYAPILEPHEALALPHNIERGMAVCVTGTGGARYAQVGSPIHLSRTPPRAPSVAHQPGADTADVLREFGVAEDAIAQLTKASA